MPKTTKSTAAKFYSVTPSRWKDFELLFGNNGACGGCWCMHWRQTQSEFDRMKGAPNKRAMKRIIESGEKPGIIGYVNGRPAAWCCVAPRKQFSKLERSRVLKPIDDTPVWAIVCLFIDKNHRRTKLSARTVEAAAEFAFSKGASIVEGYPYDTGTKKWADPFVYTGLVSSFKKAGFKIVKRPSRTRVIVRKFSGK